MTSLTKQRNQNFIGIVIILVMLAGSVIFHYFVFTKPYPGHNDFLTPWEASRSFFYDGLDPYGEEVSLAIQQRIYGRPAIEGEFPNHFAYPFYTVYIVYPFIHFDYSWATAFWMALSEAFLIGAVLLLLDLFRYRAKPITTALLILFVMMSYPGARGLILGQVSHFVFFLEVLALWALAKRRDNLAGVALAVSTFKPQMGLLIVPLILLWAVYHRRWKFVIAFSITFAILVISSFLLLPSWVEGMRYQIELYPSYIEVSTPVWVFTQYLFNLGDTGEWIVNLFFYGAMLWAWYGLFVRNHQEHFLWAVVITLTVTHLAAFRTATPHFVVFIIPCIFYLKQYARGYPIRTFLTMLALFALPWIYFLLTISNAEFEHPTNFILLPLLAFVVVWFTRQQWWNSETSQQFVDTREIPSKPHLNEANV